MLSTRHPVRRRRDRGHSAVDDPQDIRLRLRADNAADFRQWFHFRLQGARGQAAAACVFENAGRGGLSRRLARLSLAWRPTTGSNWFRVADDALRWRGPRSVERTPERDSVYFAYFEPYSRERHLDLLARGGDVALRQRARCPARTRRRPGSGSGQPSGVRSRTATQVWVIARQHPGETMAEWFVEGLLERLLDAADPRGARACCEHAVLLRRAEHEPGRRGAWATCAPTPRVRNLNREWLEPEPGSAARRCSSCARRCMRTGCRPLPRHPRRRGAALCVLLDGGAMLPGFTAAPARREQARFIAASAARASPDFQTGQGYAPDRFSDELLTLASQVRRPHASAACRSPWRCRSRTTPICRTPSAAGARRAAPGWGRRCSQPILAHLQSERMEARP
ncbi:MAG: M14-type cytosolic carboxypeptidase [Comamonadaceae bacterium]|nr:M14-type cytosolic carboxypeptidase [Comamonadaceae bacterium]